MSISSLILAIILILVSTFYIIMGMSWLALLTAPFVCWLVYLAFAPPEKDHRIVLQLGGVKWNEEDFCRG